MTRALTFAESLRDQARELRALEQAAREMAALRGHRPLDGDAEWPCTTLPPSPPNGVRKRAV